MAKRFIEARDDIGQLLLIKTSLIKYLVHNGTARMYNPAPGKTFVNVLFQDGEILIGLEVKESDLQRLQE
jgi:hypothetical protein